MKKSVYFLGIGGIGMSALARYFMHEGHVVGGYDLTESPLTQKLQSEGAFVGYTDDPDQIPASFRECETTLVIYTPAIPNENRQLEWFRKGGFTLEKRAQALGQLTKDKFVMAIAGTHGKTSTTTLTAWLNHEASAPGRADGGGGSAFLGGISRNLNSNLMLGRGNRVAVEADEYDRSFLYLTPDVAVITSTDADHLDIYGSHEAMKGAFSQFVDKIEPEGVLILNEKATIELTREDIEVYSYSLEDSGSDFHAKNIRLTDSGNYTFDIACPDRVLRGCRLGVLGRVNVENAVAAVAAVWVAGFDEERLKEALSSFEGVKRRFEIYVNSPTALYMDDYAHHPAELDAALRSMRSIFRNRKITAIFQPHLYTRTRDFYMEFGASLSHADEVVLLPIYPARELPIEGINSELIGKYITKPWRVVEKTELLEHIKREDTDIVITFGAGDIDRFCDQIADIIREKKG